MRLTHGKSLLILMIAALAAPPGCDCNTRTRTQTQTQTSVQAQRFILDAQAFDLESVVGLIKDQKVKDAQELETLINSGSGLNNVDIDKDGQIDYIGVKETQTDGGHVLDFVAVPSSKIGDPVTVASVNFSVNTTTNQLTVQGGYPNYVSGYDQAFYGYNAPYGGPSFGQMLFYSWMFSPRPMYMYHPYGYGYAMRPIMTPYALTQTRTTYRTTTHVSPIPRQTQPQNYRIPSAEPTRSRLATPTAPTGPGLSGRGDSMRDYGQRDVAKPKPQGTGFGGGSPSPTPAKPSNGWGSTQRSPSPSPTVRSPSPPPRAPSPSRSFGSTSRGGRK